MILQLEINTEDPSGRWHEKLVEIRKIEEFVAEREAAEKERDLKKLKENYEKRAGMLSAYEVF